MPISGPNSFGELGWLRNACARGYGIAAYASLGTIDANAVDDAIAHAIDRIASEGHHQWLRGESGIVTTAGYATGTAAVTISSANVTGTSTLWNTTSNVLARDVFNVGDGGFQRVASVTSDTLLSLSPAYSAATNATATYATFRDQYALPASCLRVLSVREVDAFYELEMLTRQGWAAIWEGKYEVGRPRYAILADAVDNVSNVGQYLQLYPIPNAVYGYQVLYDEAPTFPGTATTAMPGAAVAMQATLHAALAALFLHDMERGPGYEAAYQRIVGTLIRTQDRTRRQRIIAQGQFGRSQALTWPQNYGDTIGTNLG